MNKNAKADKENNNDAPEPVSKQYFDVQIQRLEQVYLSDTKDNVKTIADSMKTIKTCVELICAVSLGVLATYIITTLRNFFGA
jgi:hypothetical protein